MPTSRGVSPVPVVDEGLSGVLAGRLDAIGGDATVQRLLHGLATDMVGPFEQYDLPAAEYEWIEGAIAGAVQTVGYQATRALVAEFASRLEEAPRSLIDDLDRARVRHLVEIR
jgi:hypothetical protein